MKAEIRIRFSRCANPVLVGALDRPAFDRTQLCFLFEGLSNALDRQEEVVENLAEVEGLCQSRECCWRFVAA